MEKLSAKRICDEIEAILKPQIEQSPKMLELMKFMASKSKPFAQPPVWQPPYYNPNAPENIHNPANIRNPQNPNNPELKRPPRVESLKGKYPFIMGE